MPMTQANVVQVTLTQEEADKRRAYLTRLKGRRGNKPQDIPQEVLDYLLPRVRVQRYVDEAGEELGECWIWTRAVNTWGAPRGGEGRTGVRRWVAQQLREKPIPARWMTLADCAHERCVHPACCLPMNRSKATLAMQERGLFDMERRRRANVKTGRARSPMTPEQVQQMRSESVAAILAGKPIPSRVFACRYGIGRRAVSRILAGETWSPSTLPLSGRPVASVFDLGRLA